MIISNLLGSSSTTLIMAEELLAVFAEEVVTAHIEGPKRLYM